jgi:predicted Zn-dependent peptidase
MDRGFDEVTMRLPLPRTLALLAMAAAAIVGCTADDESPDQVSAEFPNGVRVLARENRASGVVAMQVWVGDGALYETVEQAGSAYLLSQMMFTRTRERGLDQITLELSELGGAASVNPRHDFVQYSAVIPSEHFETLAGLIQDGLTNAVFDSARFEQERAEAVENIESIRLRHMDRTHQMCVSDMFGEHPYGRPTQGTLDSVSGLRLEDIRDRYRERYVGSNLLVSIAGDVDPERAARIVGDRLSEIARGEPAEPAAPPIEWPDTPTSSIEYGDVRTAYQVMCFPAPAITDDDAITMDVLLMILTGGRSSRLDRLLVEENRIASAADAGWYTLRQPSPLFVWMETSPTDITSAADAVVELFSELAETEVSERELAKARTYWKTQISFMNETAEGQAFYDAYWTFLGWPELPEQYRESIDAVTAEDVRRAAERYLAGSYSTAVLLPEWARE